jgi:RNA polymerase sigma factor (sigma-70 family)
LRGGATNRTTWSTVYRGVRTRQVDIAGAASEGAEFSAWVLPHWAHMDRLALRLVGVGVAEDVVQDALAAAWRSWRRFDHERGSARAWLLAIVANKARDQLRRSAGRSLLIVDETVGGPHSEIEIDLTSALSRLTERRRIAVALHYYLELTVEECAEVMGCSAGTVKSTLSDARTQLREILGEEYR